MTNDSASDAAERLDGGGEALTVAFNVGSDEILGAGQGFVLPVGCVCLLRAEVFVNGERATVTSSTWTLSGNRIDRGKAVQSMDKTDVPLTNEKSVLQGGVDNNDPACIQAGWVGPVGGFSIHIKGTAKFGKKSYPFDGPKTVQLRAPTYTAVKGPKLRELEISVFNFDGPNFGFDVRSDDGLIWKIERTDALGGELGFLQVMNLFKVIRTGSIYQEKGIFAETGYPALDATEPGSYFYDDEAMTSEIGGVASIEDSPYEPLFRKDNGSTFDRYYRVDRFTTFLAFRMPVQGRIIESYAVACARVSWGWSAEAQHVEPDAWRIDKTDGDPKPFFNGLESIDWTPVTWNSNAAAPAANTWK